MERGLPGAPPVTASATNPPALFTVSDTSSTETAQAPAEIGTTTQAPAEFSTTTAISDGLSELAPRTADASNPTPSNDMTDGLFRQSFQSTTPFTTENRAVSAPSVSIPTQPSAVSTLSTGPSSGFGAGSSSGFGAGPSGGFNAGPSSGFGTGPSSGFGAGPSSGFGTGPSSGFGGGPSSGFGTGPSSGFGAGPSSGFSSAPTSGWVGSSCSGMGCWRPGVETFAAGPEPFRHGFLPVVVPCRCGGVRIVGYGYASGAPVGMIPYVPGDVNTSQGSRQHQAQHSNSLSDGLFGSAAPSGTSPFGSAAATTNSATSSGGLFGSAAPSETTS